MARVGHGWLAFGQRSKSNAVPRSLSMRMAASNFFPDLDVKPFRVTDCPARSLRAGCLVGDGLARDAREHLPSAACGRGPLANHSPRSCSLEHRYIRPVFLTGWPCSGQSPHSCASVFAVRVTTSALRFAGRVSGGFAMPPGGTCPSPQTACVCRVPRRTTPVPSVR